MACELQTSFIKGLVGMSDGKKRAKFDHIVRLYVQINTGSQNVLIQSKQIIKDVRVHQTISKLFT